MTTLTKSIQITQGRSGVSRSGRWLLALLAIGMLPESVRAETLDCERLDGSQRMLCSAMVRCSAIADSGSRAGCVSAVLQAVGVEPSNPTASAPPAAPRQATPRQQTSRPAPSPKAPAPEQKVVTVTSIPASRPAQPVPVAPPQASESTSVSDDGSDRVEVPRRFTSTVIKVRALVRNRQLVLLDNDLLFEGEGPSYDVGEKVTVVKRGRLGKSYTFSSNRGRSREFRRLPCEMRADETNQDTERKCTGFLGGD